MKRYAIILAAGKGTRMKSDLPKVCHEVCGKPMVQYLVDELTGIGVEDIFLVVGHGAEDVKKRVAGPVTFVMQHEQLGTGHAVQQVKPYLADKEGTAIVLTGDTPLLKGETLRSFVEHHERAETTGTVLTTIQANPTGYGRIISEPEQTLLAYGRVPSMSEEKVYDIIEEKDATPAVRTIDEVNTGIFCFDNQALFTYIDCLDNQNAQQEFYLTDMVRVMNQDERPFRKYLSREPEEFLGINDRVQLSQAETLMRKRINQQHMESGVTLVDPNSTWIEAGVSIGRNATVYPNVFIGKGTIIGENSVIETGSVIRNSTIGKECHIQSVMMTDSHINDGVAVKPIDYIEQQSAVAEAGESVRPS